MIKKKLFGLALISSLAFIPYAVSAQATFALVWTEADQPGTAATEFDAITKIGTNLIAGDSASSRDAWFSKPLPTGAGVEIASEAEIQTFFDPAFGGAAAASFNDIVSDSTGMVYGLNRYNFAVSPTITAGNTNGIVKWDPTDIISDGVQLVGRVLIQECVLLAMDEPRGRLALGYNDFFEPVPAGLSDGEGIYTVNLNDAGQTPTVLVSETDLEAALGGDDVDLTSIYFDSATGDLYIASGFTPAVATANADGTILKRTQSTGLLTVHATNDQIVQALGGSAADSGVGILKVGVTSLGTVAVIVTRVFNLGTAASPIDEGIVVTGTDIQDFFFIRREATNTDLDGGAGLPVSGSSFGFAGDGNIFIDSSDTIYYASQDSANRGIIEISGMDFSAPAPLLAADPKVWTLLD